MAKVNVIVYFQSCQLFWVVFGLKGTCLFAGSTQAQPTTEQLEVHSNANPSQGCQVRKRREKEKKILPVLSLNSLYSFSNFMVRGQAQNKLRII